MQEFTKHKPICPRCGYDLTGTISTWRDSCPLDGRCTECGFELCWSEVFTFSEHPWLFEYHWRRQPIRRLVLTMVNALRPRRFWRSVRLHDPVYLRPAMIVAAACIVFGLLAVIASELHGRHWINTMWFSGRPQSTGVQYWIEMVFEVVLDLPRRILDRVPGFGVALFAMPLLFVLAPVTLRRAKVRRAHVLRIWMYSLAFPACLAAAWLGVELLTEVFDWHALNRVIDPWAWFRYYNFGGDWRTYLLSAWLPGTVILTIGCAWMGIWWWHACRTYLRIRECGVMVLLLMLVLWLMSFTFEIYVQSVQSGLFPLSALD